MARADLLALTLDDLATLANRGLVKRAQRELEGGEMTGEVAEDAQGEVVVTWADGVRCTFPAGRTAREGRCTCVATSICRHLVAAVLAYQGHATPGEQETPPPQAWNPGDIPDGILKQHFRPAVLKQAADRLAEGLLMELVRGPKPTARIFQLACTVRFLVPGDVRYTHCECAERPPCAHVPLAVWAFRRLPPEQEAGMVSTLAASLPVPEALLSEAETVARDLAVQGMATVPTLWRDRVVRVEQGLREAGLVWPAEIASEMAVLYERYSGHDALFSPDRFAELVGELMARIDAVRGAPPQLPQLFVRGDASDRVTSVGKALYIGLGVEARPSRRSVAITAYLQDADSGTVVAMGRDFADPARGSSDKPRDYGDLAQAHAMAGLSLARLGAGQLLIQGGRRAPDHRLLPGRAKATLNPQGFLWEKLRPPVLVESLRELRATLALLPPASLRPRYVSGLLHVLPVAAVESAGFHATRQCVQVVVRDAGGDTALVEHPFCSRGSEGVEALLAALADEGQALRFVSGQVKLAPAGVVLAPLALVFEKEGRRTAVLPAVDRYAGTSTCASLVHDAPSGDGVDDFLRELLAHVGELLLLGVGRPDAQVTARAEEMARRSQALGFSRLAHAVHSLATRLRQRHASLRWDPTPAASELLELAVIARLAHDLSA